IRAGRFRSQSLDSTRCREFAFSQYLTGKSQLAYAPASDRLIRSAGRTGEADHSRRATRPGWSDALRAVYAADYETRSDSDAAGDFAAFGGPRVGRTDHDEAAGQIQVPLHERRPAQGHR